MKETICFGCMEKYVGSNICPYCGYDQNSKVKDSYCLEPGTILKAKYLVGCVLGSGSIGIIYMGLDLSRNSKVTIKEYMPNDYATRATGETRVIPFDDAKTQYERGFQRFLYEAKTLAQFREEGNIACIRDFFMENNTGYSVEEYMPYPTLQITLKEKQQLPYEQALKIMYQVLDALRTMHMRAIIYRDLKPDNILVTENLKVMLVYTGAASNQCDIHSDDPGIQCLNTILNSGYSPIEQYSVKGKLTPAADVYASAAILYRMITGKKPPDAYSRMQSLQIEKRDALQKPSELGIALPQGLEDAIMKALQFRQEDRYQSVDEFAEALRNEKQQNQGLLDAIRDRLSNKG